ncbi:hypothetical protein J2T12_001840 [Paenibacillus anaericanus]|uniref:DUF5668 domain-containing protein n=1 Tax=Paenibacillus anaericanus TaxID=170367 RepID=A0A433YDN8_9BACL|nr:hypothetical protein [Paenibacillus anaericanus]MDQ0088434.1 hypothetical protein [Paenibacillus anaericanus]RUT47957.1 hypothetical protein EJP82_06180 [Paenibacillus anaericanus]
MTDNNKLTTGILILAAGIIILLGKLGVFSFLGKALWPLLLLIPGILFHLWHYLRRGPAELLLPGGILITYSILFFIANIWGFGTLKYTWPFFILGIAIGLLEYDLASAPSQRQSGVLLAALILGVFSVIMLGWTLFSLSIIYLIAIVLIIGGILLITARGKSRRLW